MAKMDEVNIWEAWLQNEYMNTWPDNSTGKTIMNRSRVPKQHRRYSLPATSSLAPFGCRSVPEGSDTFQKALEELYTSEPNHAPLRESSGHGLTGLNNIIEGNESDYQDSEDDNVGQSYDTNDVIQMSRRHSSPSCFSKDDLTGQLNTDASVRKIQNSLIKSHNQYRKDYFIKHGHWPTKVTSNQAVPRKSSVPKSINDRPNKSQTVAFGTSSAPITSAMAKLRI